MKLFSSVLVYRSRKIQTKATAFFSVINLKGVAMTGYGKISVTQCVLILAWVEFIFFTGTDMGLSSGFVLNTVMII